MPTQSFDVVIVGGGNAGFGASVAPRKAGLTVALVEPDLLGGTFPNGGCMPKNWNTPLIKGHGGDPSIVRSAVASVLL